MALLDHKARNLDDAIRNLDPVHSLEIKELSNYYVEREHSPIRRVEKMLSITYPQKFLFTGHRGNGKSTELARLESELQDQFFVVRYSLKNVLDFYDLSYVDVLLSLALQLAESVSNNIKLSKSTRDILEHLWSFGQDIERQTETGSTRGGQAELGFGEVVSTFMQLRVRIRSEHATREVLREKVRHRISDLLKGLDILAKDISEKTGKKVLCIVEDLDKIELDEAKKIFYDHGKSISAPELAIIYTFPIALSHSDEFMQVLNFFSDNYVLPNFKTTDEMGREGLQNLLFNRVEASLFDEEAISLLVKYSGGVPRQLITLARVACLEATDAEETTVTKEHVQEAVSIERQNFARSLQSEERLVLLRRVRSEKKIDQALEYQKLLQNLSILEYSNHNIWYDVNPLVDDLLER